MWGSTIQDVLTISSHGWTRTPCTRCSPGQQLGPSIYPDVWGGVGDALSKESERTEFEMRLSTVQSSDVTLTMLHSDEDSPESTDALDALGMPIELVSVLGQGGMGTVFLGRQALPTRDVAVKKARVSGGKLENLLLLEATIAGSLEHPNIVPIHEIRRSEDSEIEVVMKRIQGTTLRDLIGTSFQEKGYLEKALTVLIQATHALEFAHSQGVVHRDIKTQNIMIGDFGETYLLDWGIAIQMNNLSSFQDGLVGTPSGMAPEMLSGNLKDISKATDIFLLGSTLHEILTGKTRYQDDGPDLFREIRRSEPFVYSSDVPVELAELVNRCCHKSPKARVGSVLEFREALEKYQKLKNASELLAMGMREMKVAEAIIEQPNRSKLERTKLYYHIHRARFAYERALAINPSLSEALTRLQELVNKLARMLLDEGNHEAAAWFGESSGLLQPSIQGEIEEAMERAALIQRENERLQNIGKINDPKASFRTRTGLGIGLLICSLLMIYSLFSSQNQTLPVSGEQLVVESLVLLVVVGGVLSWMRRRIVATPDGQRAFVGVMGALGGILAIRWTCSSFGIAPGVTITLEKFIAAVAFFGSYPAIPSGAVIGGLCVAGGFVGVLEPSLQITSSAIMLFLIITLLARDTYYALQEGGLKKTSPPEPSSSSKR